MENTKRWGAHPEEWQKFIDFGLIEDLLPVVSKLNAPISPNSTMKHLGKTPSLYNAQGLVVGIKDWTNKRATEEEVRAWMSEPDYGICIQTRYLRAFDIDVDDPVEVKNILSGIEDMLGLRPPLRFRTNSSKCLLAFKMKDGFRKRTIKTKNGMIECLGDGQQFIAAGTHPSGERYQWDWVRFKEDRKRYA